MKRRGWPAGVAVRHRPNEITRTWIGHETDLAANPEALEAYCQRMSNNDPDVAMIYYGQGAGAIGEIASARSIIDTMVADALVRLRRWSS